MNQNLSIVIWTAVVLAVFLFIWRKGYLAKMTNYVAETQEELKKCTWPTWQELAGSSVVVVISTIILGIYTLGLDFVIYRLLRMII